MNHFIPSQFSKRVVASVVVRLLLTFASTSMALGENVEVSAKSHWISTTEIELTVEATIAPGIHIYGLEQSRPILATRIQFDPSDAIESIGSFESVPPPKRHAHEQLGIEVLEHFDRAQWRTRIVVRNGHKLNSINGSLFAQSCEDEKCFPPETYLFQTEISELTSDFEESTALPMAEKLGSVTDAAKQSEAMSILDSLQVTPSANQQATIWSILPIAFIAGFLLNFMPCVLPVVGIKLLSLVKQSELNRRRVLLTNVFYSTGLISVMIVLASLAVFACLGWGQQFSHLGFSVTLIGLVFAFSLSLLGVWELPSIGLSRTKTESNGYASAFGNGVLSTVLATPCSGPFLGAALAWAVAQPAYWTYTIFVAIGFGMASPFLLIGMFPKLVRFLPKPGAWMIVFKQVTGFVMLVSVVYLISTLPTSAVIPTLLLILGVGIALWLTSFVPVYDSLLRRMRVWSVASLIVAVVAVVSFGWLKGVTDQRFERDAIRLLSTRGYGDSLQQVKTLSASLNQQRSIVWENFSKERLEELLQAGKPVFLDFTADWCLTCKSNELLAIETEDVANALMAGNVVAMKADKTVPNPNADQLLRKLGNSSASIPYYAVFPAGQPSKPIVMDGLYSSPDVFVKNIQSAF